MDALSEIGEGKHSGDILTSIGWVDIDAWMSATGSRMTPGELAGLRHLSAAYVSQHYASRDPACVSPCIVDAPDAGAVESKLKSLFAVLRK